MANGSSSGEHDHDRHESCVLLRSGADAGARALLRGPARQTGDQCACERAVELREHHVDVGTGRQPHLGGKLQGENDLDGADAEQAEADAECGECRETCEVPNGLGEGMHSGYFSTNARSKT